MDKLNATLRILIISCVTVHFALSAVNVKLTNIECTVLEKGIAEFTKCSLKAVKRNVVEINVYVRLDLKPINNASVKLRLAKRGGHKRNSLYEYKVDACEFLRSSRRNPLADIFYSFFEMQKYSNLNHTCPYDHDLIIERCRLNTKPLSILPIAHGEYKIYTTWFVYGKPMANVDLAIIIN